MSADAEFDQYPPLVDIPDDDDMPPLVDRPPVMMTYTFGNDFTPITFSTDPTRFEIVPDEDTPRIVAAPLDDEEGSAVKSHAKKRDASYIPRPPNAFILFRSSFIKSQQIPGKIEGNHSTLSKIIGMVWKGLSQTEREHWEAQAVKAQAEHRARYPHWRFRPSSNPPKAPPGSRKRKNRDEGDGGGGNRKRNKSKAGAGSEKEKRCAKIAGLLAEGMKGDALETAVQAWDRATGVALAAAEGSPAHALPSSISPSADAQAAKARSASPADDARFVVPLTAMFKRSASAPVSPVQPLAPLTPAPVAWTQRCDPIGSVYEYEALASPVLSEAASGPYSPVLEFANMGLPQTEYVFSPPGSPFSADSDISSIGPFDSTSLPAPMTNSTSASCNNVAIDIGPLALPDMQPDYVSSYSSLCDWAGGFAFPSGDKGTYNPHAFSAADVQFGGAEWAYSGARAAYA